MKITKLFSRLIYRMMYSSIVVLSFLLSCVFAESSRFPDFCYPGKMWFQVNEHEVSTVVGIINVDSIVITVMTNCGPGEIKYIQPEYPDIKVNGTSLIFTPTKVGGGRFYIQCTGITAIAKVLYVYGRECEGFFLDDSNFDCILKLKNDNHSHEITRGTHCVYEEVYDYELVCPYENGENFVGMTYTGYSLYSFQKKPLKGILDLSPSSELSYSFPSKILSMHHTTEYLYHVGRILTIQFMPPLPSAIEFDISTMTLEINVNSPFSGLYEVEITTPHRIIHHSLQIGIKACPSGTYIELHRQGDHGTISVYDETSHKTTLLKDKMLVCVEEGEFIQLQAETPDQWTDQDRVVFRDEYGSLGSFIPEKNETYRFHASQLIAMNSAYRFLHNPSELPETWTHLSYNDKEWKTSVSSLWPLSGIVYFRKEFFVRSLTDFTHAVLTVKGNGTITLHINAHLPIVSILENNETLITIPLYELTIGKNLLAGKVEGMFMSFDAKLVLIATKYHNQHLILYKQTDALLNLGICTTGCIIVICITVVILLAAFVYKKRMQKIGEQLLTV